MRCCRTELCVDADALALKGYDPVSYFARGAPERGTPDNALIWHGAVFQFRAREHQVLFLKDPQRYAPQYGGYCAFGMAFGRVDEADPTTWAVIDARLYLAAANDVLKEWTSRLAQNIRQADERWACRLKRLG